MNIKRLLISISLILIISCAKKQTVSAPLPADDAFELATSYFKEKQYNKAIAEFERILFYHPASEYVDDAQYYLGRAYFEKKDYNQAISEFDYLIKNFSTSKFIEDAYFYRAHAYLNKAPGYEKDPTELENAISLFNYFLTKFPNSKYTDQAKKLILSARNQLAKKELENGKLYVKLGEKNAALIYFNYVIENYPETTASNEAKFQAAELYYKQGLDQKALSLYQELLEEKKWQDKVSEKIAEIKKKLKINR